MKVPMRINTQFGLILGKCGIFCRIYGENILQLRQNIYPCKLNRFLFLDIIISIHIKIREYGIETKDVSACNKDCIFPIL